MAKKPTSNDHPDTQTVLGLFGEHLRSQGRQPATIAAYGHDARLFLDYLTHSQIPSWTSVSDDTLDGFQEYLRSIGQRRPNSHRRTFLGVRLFYRFLEDTKLIRSSPLDETTIPTRHEVRQRPLSADNINGLLTAAAAEPFPLKAARDQSVVALLAFEGVKTTELVKLRWVDLLADREHQALRIGGTRPRMITLQPPTKVALMKYRELHEQLSAPLVAKSPEKMMFVGFKGPHCGLVLPNMSRHGLKFLLYELGTPLQIKHLNAEMLRSHAMKHLLDSGLAPEQVMNHLGLRQIGSIARHVTRRRRETSND